MKALPLQVCKESQTEEDYLHTLSKYLLRGIVDLSSQKDKIVKSYKFQTLYKSQGSITKISFGLDRILHNKDFNFRRFMNNNNLSLQLFPSEFEQLSFPRSEETGFEVFSDTQYSLETAIRILVHSSHNQESEDCINIANPFDSPQPSPEPNILDLTDYHHPQNQSLRTTVQLYPLLSPMEEDYNPFEAQSENSNSQQGIVSQYPPGSFPPPPVIPVQYHSISSPVNIPSNNDLNTQNQAIELDRLNRLDLNLIPRRDRYAPPRRDRYSHSSSGASSYSSDNQSHPVSLAISPDNNNNYHLRLVAPRRTRYSSVSSTENSDTENCPHLTDSSLEDFSDSDIDPPRNYSPICRCPHRHRRRRTYPPSESDCSDYTTGYTSSEPEVEEIPIVNSNRAQPRRIWFHNLDSDSSAEEEDTHPPLLSREDSIITVDSNSEEETQAHRNLQSRNQRGRQIRCHSCNIPVHCHHCGHRENLDRQGVNLLNRPDTPRPREDQPQLETEDRDTDNIEREIANSEPIPNLREILEDFETEFDLYQNILEPMDIE